MLTQWFSQHSIPFQVIGLYSAGGHLSDDHPKVSNRQTRIVVTNLARISVLLQMVQLPQLSMAVPALRSFMNEPLVGGCTWSEELGRDPFACTGDDYDGQAAASVTFYATGRHYRTDWFRFQIEVSRGDILRLEPVNLAARQVRVLDDEEVKQELVEDMAKAKARKRLKLQGIPVWVRRIQCGAPIGALD